MDLLLLGLQFALAIVLAVAGISKVADLAGSREAVREFGVPEQISDVVGTALPFAELIIAIALIPRFSVREATIASFCLFAIFSVAIAYNMARGRHPDCHCFGQLHSRPAGWSTLVRNAGLMLGAGVVVWQGGRSPVDTFRGMSVTSVLLTVLGVLTVSVIGALVWLMSQLWQQNGRLLLRIEALERQYLNPANNGRSVGNSNAMVQPYPAPEFDLPAVDDGRLTLHQLRQSSRPTLLVFTDPQCGPCNQLMPDMAAWQRNYGEQLQVALISRGSLNANRAKAQEHGISLVGVQNDREVSQAFGVTGTPSAILVGPDGLIYEPVATGAVPIRALVGLAISGSRSLAAPLPTGAGDGASNHASHRPGIGEPAPRFSLPNLAEEIVSLDDIIVRETAVLFWNPGCGFCQRMLPDLRNWEAIRPDGAPDLLIVSAGSVQANRDMGLRSTIVIDGGFATGRMFGASGTPSAVLVDRGGRIASSLVVGGPAVMELLSPSVVVDAGHVPAG